jgi:hypothetical protein
VYPSTVTSAVASVPKLSPFPRRNRGGVADPSLFFSMYELGFGDIAHAKDALDTPATIKKGVKK